MEKWEFNCPQFVDFLFEADHFTDDVFTGTSKDEILRNECSDKAVISKMATPKMKAVKSFKNSPFVNVSRPISTDDEKVAFFGKLTSRMSKSDGCLNKAISEQENAASKSRRKRTLSDSYIKKKRIYPTTPECLKRTLMSKHKKGKTTEELELELISDMQNKLQQQLRLNRMNLKRMKMNKSPLASRFLSRKNNIEPVCLENKESEDVKIPSRPVSNSDNRKLRCYSEKACDNVRAYVKPAQNVKKVNTGNGKQNDIRITSTNVLRDLNGLNKDAGKIKKVPIETYHGHGGLKFIPRQKKTVPEIVRINGSSSSFNASQRSIDAHTSAYMKTPSLNNKENLVK